MALSIDEIIAMGKNKNSQTQLPQTSPQQFPQQKKLSVDEIIAMGKKDVEKGLFREGVEELGGLTLGAIKSIPSTLRNVAEFGQRGLGFLTGFGDQVEKDIATQRVVTQAPERGLTAARKAIGASNTSESIGGFLGDVAQLSIGTGAISGATKGVELASQFPKLASAASRVPSAISSSLGFASKSAGISSLASIQSEGRLPTTGEATIGLLMDSALLGTGRLLKSTPNFVRWASGKLKGVDDITLKEMQSNPNAIKVLSRKIAKSSAPVLNIIDDIKTNLIKFKKKIESPEKIQGIVGKLRKAVDGFDEDFKARYKQQFKILEKVNEPLPKQALIDSQSKYKRTFEKFGVKFTKRGQLDFSETKFAGVDSIESVFKTIWSDLKKQKGFSKTALGLNNKKSIISNRVRVTEGVNADVVSSLVTGIGDDINSTLDRHAKDIIELNKFYSDSKNIVNGIFGFVDSVAAEGKVAGIMKLGKGDFLKSLKDFDQRTGSTFLKEIKDLIIEPTKQNTRLLKEFTRVLGGSNPEKALRTLFEGEFKEVNKRVVKQFDKQFGTEIFNKLEKLHTAQKLRQTLPQAVKRISIAKGVGAALAGGIGAFAAPVPAALGALGLGALSSPASAIRINQALRTLKNSAQVEKNLLKAGRAAQATQRVSTQDLLQ